MKSTLLIVLLVFSSFAARADKTDDLVKSVMQSRKVPGVAVAVVKGGKVVKIKSYGIANLELGVPVTTKTVFEIGSVTKQMTAAAIMLLVEDGKVKLDERIAAYIPNAPEAWRDVSVRNLLTHTSGVKSYTSIGAGFELIKRMNRDQFVAKLAPYPLDFAPGTKYSYSNSGYSLLGFVIESASGMSYRNFMKTRIFGPLGMSETADRDPKFLVPNRADGYELENGAYIGRDWDLTDLSSAGAIVSTIGDLTKWDLAWRNGTLLKKSSMEEAWKPFTLADGTVSQYGFGWNVADYQGHRLIAHNGATAGFNSSVMRFVNDDVTVIVLTNLGDKGYAGEIARGVAKMWVKGLN